MVETKKENEYLSDMQTYIQLVLLCRGVKIYIVLQYIAIKYN